MGTRLTFFGEQPSPYDDHRALLYASGATGSIAAAGLIVAWRQRRRPMASTMGAMLTFACVVAGVAVVEHRSRDRRIVELHDLARASADDFEPPTGLTERERIELVAGWDRNSEFGNVRISLRPASVAPDPAAIVDDLTVSFCEPHTRPVVEHRSDTIAVADAVAPELTADVLIPSADRLRAAGAGAGADVTVTFRSHRAGEMPGRQDLDLTC